MAELRRFTSTPRVLVVEDDDLLLELTAESLEYLGAQVETARSFAAGAEALRSDPCFDAVIADLTLDGKLVGIQLLEIAIARGAGTATVLMSGLGPNSHPEVDRTKAPYRFLRKPFGMGDLFSVLDCALRTI